MANKTMGALMMKLLTESCRQPAEKAIQYEGQTAIATSFQVLGQVAGRELFQNAEVAAGVSAITNYVDEKRLADLGKGERSAEDPAP